MGNGCGTGSKKNVVRDPQPANQQEDDYDYESNDQEYDSVEEYGEQGSNPQKRQGRPQVSHSISNRPL